MRKLQYWVFLSALALSACGGGGGGSSDSSGSSEGSGGNSGGGTTQPPVVTQPTVTSRIGLADGDTYTFDLSLQSYDASGKQSSISNQTYSLVIRNPLNDLSYESVAYGQDGGKTISLYSSSQAQISETTNSRSCTYKNGQYNPGHQPFVGQTWTVLVEVECVGTTAGAEKLISTVEMDARVVAKGTLTTAAGQFSTYKVESRRVTKPHDAGAKPTYFEYVCWYDEVSSIALNCNYTSRADSHTGPILTTRQTTLIGIDAKGHPAVSRTAKRFLGKWVISNSDKSICTAWGRNIPGWQEVEFVGACVFPTPRRNAEILGTINSQGELNAKVGDDIVVRGSLTMPGGRGSWVGSTTESWTAIRE